MRGEFRLKNGLILPNNISLAGSQAILTAWAQNVVPVFYFGLVKGAPTATMRLNDVQEPTVGTNGYQRIHCNRDATDWSDFGNVGAENYIGTKDLVFTAVGGNFNKAITRVAMFNTNVVDAANPIMALSSPLPNDFIVTPTTPLVDRTFQYRLYL